MLLLNLIKIKILSLPFPSIISLLVFVFVWKFWRYILFIYFGYLLLWLDIKYIKEQHPRAGLNIQHVLYEQLARAGQNT